MTISIQSFAQTEESLVKQTIETAYIGGIHNGGAEADIRTGFHPSFIMSRFNNNEILTVTLDQWVTNTLKSRSQNTNADGPKAVAQYNQIQIAGNAANVSLDLYRGDKKIFTDNLLLYKFNEGWRIVSKTFYRHP